jgi:hypothetical protein
MKKWILIAFLLATSKCYGIGLGVELTTHTFVGNTGVGTALVTPPVNSLGSTFCVAEITANFPSTPVMGDSYANVWTSTAATANISANQITQLYYSSNPVTGPNHMFTAGLTGGVSIFGSMAVACFAGVLTTYTPFDVWNSTVATINTLNQNTNSITPTSNNDLIITALGYNNASLPVSINAGFLVTDSVEFNASNFGSGLAYFVQPTAAAINPTWTKSGSAGQMSTSIASFKAAPFITNVPRSVIIK